MLIGSIGRLNFSIKIANIETNIYFDFLEEENPSWPQIVVISIIPNTECKNMFTFYETIVRHKLEVQIF